MTKEEFFASGKYADFLLIDDVVYEFPLGYKLSETPQEKSNIVTVASGRKRYDIIKRWYSYTFEYETLFEDAFNTVQRMVDVAVLSQNKVLYVKRQNHTDNSDYKTAIIDVIKKPKVKYKTRGKLYIYNGVTIDLE